MAQIPFALGLTRCPSDMGGPTFIPLSITYDSPQSLPMRTRHMKGQKILMK